ncbi:MAG TPA: T9SS type A sorting domain-containing protein [Flavobacterium sp.]|jgi:alpha-tubulin suppressor-like RCC1 family protein
MKKTLLLLLSLTLFKSYSQECVDRLIVSDDMVTVELTDGSLYTWGQNQYGQLGNGSTTSQMTPAPTISGSQWQNVSHARMHTMALKNDGTIWAWGINIHGMLGNGTTTNSHVPLQVGTGTNWTAISAGNLHSVALKADGTMWGWGSNGAMEISNQTSSNNHLTPFQMSPDTDWAQIHAGYFRTFGIKTNGTLWGRGNSSYGSVGIGWGGFAENWTQIGTANNWARISAARSPHTLALKTDGTLWAWGDNENGRLGDGTTTTRYAPVQIGTDHWKDVAAGNYHSIGIKMDGTLWQWGSYGWINGQMMIPNSSVPVQVGTDNNWKSVAAGYSSSHAIKEDNSLWAWGYNGGWLGDGTTVSTPTPMMVIACSLGNEAFDDKRIALYPNPASDFIRFHADIHPESYEIVNALGQKIISGLFEEEIAVSNFASGLYFAVFKYYDGAVQVNKFVKQ